MRRHRPTPAAARAPRPGFTLVEMLVVIAIIGVLASLSAAAIFRWIGNQSQDTTETVLRDVYQVLERQMKAVVEKADKETIPASVLTMAGNDQRRARVIWKKLRLKQEFPTTFAEALNPYAAPGSPISATDLPAKVPYVRALSKAVSGPGDSAACLLLALSQNRGGIRLSPDELPSNVLGDSNGDGVKELLDAWGKPISFYRWPTGNTELLSMNPAPAGSKAAKFADPLDPDGLLLSPTWYGSTGYKQFVALCHPVSLNGQTALYIIPSLASAGRDNQFGLDATMREVSTDAADNIYSFRLRLGIRGSTQ